MTLPCKSSLRREDEGLPIFYLAENRVHCVTSVTDVSRLRCDRDGNQMVSPETVLGCRKACNAAVPTELVLIFEIHPRL
jgi:hypothetical protein